MNRVLDANPVWFVRSRSLFRDVQTRARRPTAKISIRRNRRNFFLSPDCTRKVKRPTFRLNDAKGGRTSSNGAECLYHVDATPRLKTPTPSAVWRFGRPMVRRLCEGRSILTHAATQTKKSKENTLKKWLLLRRLQVLMKAPKEIVSFKK